ncbi:MAG TPA: hypothetical protein DDZ89_14095 [Clostridiales bacterium]|nr:hypothetical protein [Clostridiales bacterium]
MKTVSQNEKGQKIITFTFNQYNTVVMMIFCSLYPFVLAVTTLTRLDIGKPLYLIPILLFITARFLTHLDETDDEGKFAIKIKGVIIPVKYLSYPLPFVFMLVNFKAYTLRSPLIFLIDWVVLTLFYSISLVSKKNALSMMKIVLFLFGLILGGAGFYGSFLISTDLATTLSFLCLMTYGVGMLLIAAGQISINSSAVKEMVEKFLRFVRNILRQIFRIVSPKQNFYRIMNFFTKKNQKTNIAYDDILEDIGQNQLMEDADNDHPKYYFKNIRKFIDLMLKIRYSYGFVVSSLTECGIQVDDTETAIQLQCRLKKEFDETDDHYVFNEQFSQLTSTYEVVRYAERLPDPAEYADIENDVKNTVRLAKSIVKKQIRSKENKK